jgi:hypothetical protein
MTMQLYAWPSFFKMTKQLYYGRRESTYQKYFLAEEPAGHPHPCRRKPQPLPFLSEAGNLMQEG